MRISVPPISFDFQFQFPFLSHDLWVLFSAYFLAIFSFVGIVDEADATAHERSDAAENHTDHLERVRALKRPVCRGRR